MKQKNNFKIRQAVILAAGNGTRLKPLIHVPKVLIEFKGKSILLDKLETLSAIGIEKFIIISGYGHDVLESYVNTVIRPLGFNVTLVPNDLWNKTNNGYTLKYAYDYVDENFLVVMGDHIYDPSGIAGIVNSKGDFVCAVDSNPKYVDISEATKVFQDNACVQDIGKGITKYNCVDIGLFACLTNIYTLLDECLQHTGTSFNDFKRYWIQKGNVMQAFDVNGALWSDVDEVADLIKIKKIFSKKFFFEEEDVYEYTDRAFNSLETD